MDRAPANPAEGTAKLTPGGYQLGRRIHAGSSASIYEAVHPRIPGTFAVKLLERALARDARAAQAFRADIEATAALRHPNLVQILDIDQMPDGRPFIVMELLQGQDLEQRLAGNAALPIAETVSIVDGIAAGLAAAHARGVVHRDLRPTNIFLVPVVGHDTPFVKILNFGMSSLRASTQVGAGNIHVVSEPHTLAPEQALGQTDAIDARTDEFALAAIAFRMLTGTHAFRGDDPLAVLGQIAREPPRSLAMRSTCPPGVEPTLLRALAKAKAARYPTVLEFARAFREAALAPRPRGATPPPPAPEDPRQPPAAGNTGYLAAGLRPPPPSSFDDELLDVDERVFRPRSPLRAILLFFVLLGTGAGALFFAGDRLPETWRRADLWQRFHLPHGLGPEVAATAPGPEKVSGLPVATVPPAASPAMFIDAGVAVASHPDAAALAPDAAAPTPPAPVLAEPETPARPSKAKRRAHPRGPIPARGYVWSDAEQRLVPAGRDAPAEGGR